MSETPPVGYPVLNDAVSDLESLAAAAWADGRTAEAMRLFAGAAAMVDGLDYFDADDGAGEQPDPGDPVQLALPGLTRSQPARPLARTMTPDPKENTVTTTNDPTTPEQPTNDERADRAQVALAAYVEARGDPRSDDPDPVVWTREDLDLVDLLTDLLHLADREGAVADRVLAAARGHHDAETGDEW